MNKNILFLWLTFFVATTLSACSDNSKEKDISDYIPEQIALQNKLDLLEQQKQDFSLPSWVSELNINIPIWLTLNKDLSYKTTEEIDWFNSIRFLYSWDYETAMQQAENIAKSAGIGVSEEFQMAQDIVKKMWTDSSDQIKDLMWDLNGIIYTNYSLTKNPDSQYIVSISVEWNWTLEIVITDWQKMQNASVKH